MLSPTLLHSFLHFNFYLYFRTNSTLATIAVSLELMMILLIDHGPAGIHLMVVIIVVVAKVPGLVIGWLA